MKMIFLSLLWLLGGIFSTGCSQAIIKSYSHKDLDPNTLCKNSLVYSLPKGMIRIQLKPLEKPQGYEELTIEAVYIPDPKHTYVMKYHTNPSYDDDVKVTLTDKGMLSKIDVTTESKAGEIVMRVIEIAKETIKIATLPGKTLTPEGQYFDLVLDPEVLIKVQPKLIQLKELKDRKLQRDTELQKAKEDANEQKIEEIGLEIKGIKRDIDTTKESIKKEYLILSELLDFGVTFIRLTPPEANSWPTGDIRENQGVFYRPLMPYTFEIHFSKHAFSKTLLLPNKSPLIAFDITRPAFIKKVINLTFTDGALTEVHLTKPSEILAGLKIPLDIVKAVAALPKELLTFKVEYSQEYNKYLQEQINEIKNKQQLEELQRAKTEK